MVIFNRRRNNNSNNNDVVGIETYTKATYSKYGTSNSTNIGKEKGIKLYFEFLSTIYDNINVENLQQNNYNKNTILDDENLKDYVLSSKSICQFGEYLVHLRYLDNNNVKTYKPKTILQYLSNAYQALKALFQEYSVNNKYITFFEDNASGWYVFYKFFIIIVIIMNTLHIYIGILS